MRVSVYVQCFSCIVLLLFPNAHDLLKSSFRASMLTMYAIGFSFFIAHSTINYSLQSILVAHCFVDILLLSAFSLMCFHRSLRNWRHYATLIGGIPFAIWTLVQAAGRHTTCYDSLQFQTISVESHTLKLYKGFWVVSIVAYTLSIPLLLLICFPRTSARLQPCVGWVAVLSWFLATVSTVTVSEVTMAAVFYVDSSNKLNTLQTMDWSFGQVMAVVMLPAFVLARPMLELDAAHQVTRIGEGRDPASLYQHRVPADVIDMEMGADRRVDRLACIAGRRQISEKGRLQLVPGRYAPGFPCRCRDRYQRSCAGSAFRRRAHEYSS